MCKVFIALSSNYRDKGIIAFQKVINSNTDAEIKELAKKHLAELQLIK
jgi:hypothetical protein